MNPKSEEVLRRSSLIRFVPEEHYARVRDLFDEVRFDFGDYLIRQGEPADAFYVLVAGRARVLREVPGAEEIPLNRLVPGDEFGEGALLDGGTRNASVRASSTVEALRLGREDFLRLVEAYPSIRESLELLGRWRTLHGFLYEFSNFGRLPAPALHALMACLRPRTAAQDEVLVREGDPAGPMFILRSGRARAFSGAKGSEVNRAFYRAGDYFGELSILNGTSRAATVVAVSACELLCLEPSDVEELRRKHPEFDRLLRERLAQYQRTDAARLPLDFWQETLPAQTLVADKTAGASEAGDGDEPFAQDGFFGRRAPLRGTFPFVAQIDQMDCGVASLAMVCRHFGRKVALARLRTLCHTANDGTSLSALCAAATELGLAARSVKASGRHLDDLPLPAICHWEGNHWIVLYAVGTDSVRVADPANGRRRVPRAEFLQKWTGYAALFDYTEAFEQAPEDAPTLAWLRPFLTGHGGSWALVGGLALMVSVLGLLVPVLTQFVVDKVIVDGDVALLSLVLGALGVTAVLMLSANLIQQYLLSHLAVRIDSAVLDFLTRRLLSLPMSYFHSRRTGDIQRRLDGARQVRLFLVQNGVGGSLAALQAAGCVALMAVYSLKLAGVFLLVLPAYAALMWFSRRVLRPLFSDIEEAHGKYASHQIDAIKGIEAVKAAGAEGGFRDAMLSQFLEVSRQQFRGNFVGMAHESALQAISVVATLLFLWAGAQEVTGGRMTVGAFVAFSSLMAMATAAITRVLGVWDDLQVVTVLLDRLNDLFGQEPEQGADRSRLRPVPTLEGHLSLNRVGFRYGGAESPAILQDIQLEIPAGRVCAIVGRSGCGKTTLVKLVAGLLEPTEGTILFDRMDAKGLNHRDLRKQIGFVLQENHLFDDTILRNIAFGDPEPDFDRVLRAAQRANAHEFIQRLPLGYETRVGETGLAISGGQRQRIAIARALYQDPPILIFDEATSALDAESERAIQSNMGQLMQGRTCLIIAHRLSTIRDAQMIVVMDQGRIVETGTHDALMASRGLYFHLTSQQLGLS
jgi:ATP-binding cassette subfamily B protein